MKVHFDHIKAPQKILCILLKIGAFLLIFLYVIGWLEQYNIIDVHIFLVLFIEILLIFCVPFRGATSFDMSILADISLFVYVTHGILIYIMGYHVAVKTNSIFLGLCVLELMVSFIFVLGYRRLSLIKKL